MKNVPDDPEGCSDFERVLLRRTAVAAQVDASAWY